MLKSIGTKIEGHSGDEIRLSSAEAYRLLSERRFGNIEQCAFLLSFLDISPESEEWKTISDILNEIKYPQHVVSDFLLERDFEVSAVANCVNFTKTYVDEDLHCDAANTHFEKIDIGFEEMILQQNLRVYFYITGQNGTLAAQIMLFGIITLMPLQPIVSLNNSILLPGVLYPLKLTREVANQLHHSAMRRFIFDHKQEIIDTIRKEAREVLSDQKSTPELITALGKMVNDYIWLSKLGLTISSLARELQTVKSSSKNREEAEQKVERILSDIVSKIENYTEPKEELNFDRLLVKPGRMVRSSSRKTQHLVPNL